MPVVDLRTGCGGCAGLVVDGNRSAVSADEPKKADKVPTFKADVAPLLNNMCANCHSGIRKKAGLDVASYDSIMRIVKAGDPDKSRLVKSVSGTGAKLMPPKTGLTKAEIEVLKGWIAAGAKNN